MNGYDAIKAKIAELVRMHNNMQGGRSAVLSGEYARVEGEYTKMYAGLTDAQKMIADALMIAELEGK